MCAPLAAEWRGISAEVRHTFTHFHLSLRVEVAEVGAGALPSGEWRVWTPALEASLPTVMKKALRLGRAAP